MNIAIIVSSLSNGGAERVASLLANNFVENGHKVHLIAAVRDDKGYHIDNNVNYYVVKKIKPVTATRIIQISSYLKRVKIDMVISFLIKESLGAILNGIPTITSLRFDPFSEYGKSQKKWMEFVFKKSAKVIYQTNMAKELYGDLLCDNGCVIANPIKEDLPKWNEHSNSKIFIAVGRLQPVKNYPMLIKAFSRFHKSNPSFLLHIYGQGPEKQNLNDLINNLEASEFIELKGYVDNIYDIMANSFAYCQTSNHEGLSNSMLEAMAIGIPVICTDCPIGGPREYIKSGENGFLVDVGDEDGLARIMDYYVNNLVDKSEMSQKEIYRVSELTEKKICEKWGQVLKEILGE